jgi:hypothetical protein
MLYSFTQTFADKYKPENFYKMHKSLQKKEEKRFFSKRKYKQKSKLKKDKNTLVSPNSVNVNALLEKCPGSRISPSGTMSSQSQPQHFQPMNMASVLLYFSGPSGSSMPALLSVRN